MYAIDYKNNKVAKIVRGIKYWYRSWLLKCARVEVIFSTPEKPNEIWYKFKWTNPQATLLVPYKIEDVSTKLTEEMVDYFIAADLRKHYRFSYLPYLPEHQARAEGYTKIGSFVPINIWPEPKRKREKKPDTPKGLWRDIAEEFSKNKIALEIVREYVMTMKTGEDLCSFRSDFKKLFEEMSTSYINCGRPYHLELMMRLERKIRMQMRRTFLELCEERLGILMGTIKLDELNETL